MGLAPPACARTQEPAANAVAVSSYSGHAGYVLGAVRGMVLQQPADQHGFTPHSARFPSSRARKLHKGPRMQMFRVYVCMGKSIPV